MNFAEVQALILEGKLDPALEILDAEKNLTEWSISSIVQYYREMQHIYNLKGNYKRCLIIVEQVINLAKLVKDEDLLIDTLIEKGDILWKWYKLDMLNEVIEEAEHIVFNRKDMISEKNLTYFSKFKHLKGAYFRFNGDLDVAYEYFLESFSQAELLPDKHLLSLCYNALGLVLFDMGEYEDSKVYLEQSKLMRQDGDELDLATTLFNLGRISESLGQITEALNYYTRALQIGMNRACVRTQALNTNALGLLYHKLNQTENAIKYLNESFFNFQKLDNEYYLAKIIFDIVKVYTMHHRMNAVYPFLDHIDQIVKSTDSAMINLFHELSWASYNRFGDRLHDRAQAMITFRKISFQEIKNYSLFVYAALNLTSMYFAELKFTSNKEVLDDLHQLMKLFRIEHRNKSSQKLLIESFILESKLARLEYKHAYAYEILDDAYEIALKNNNKEMQIKISNEYDALLEDYREDEDLKLNESIFERIENAELEDYIADLLQSRVRSFDYVMENPVLLLVVDDDNNHLLTKPLDTSKEIDNEYVHSVLVAIDGFVGESLNRRASKLERLKHGSIYIIFRKIYRYKIIYCFESDASFVGMERFESVVNLFRPLLGDEPVSLDSKQDVHDRLAELF